MRILFLAKDMGYTEICDLGAIQAIDRGCVSMAGVMLGMPGAEKALEALKYRQWVSLCWQPDADGWEELERMPMDALVAKLRGSILRCIRIYGRAPYALLPAEGKIGEAMKTVSQEFGIKTCWMEAYGITEIPEDSYPGLGFENFPEYRPLETVKKAAEETENLLVPLRPGFLDDEIMAKTLHTPYSIHRMADQRLLCSQMLRTWLAETDAQVVSLRDVIDGTMDYKNHQKAVEV